MTRSDVEQIVDERLKSGDPRSRQYREGMLAVLLFKFLGTRIDCPYKSGSVDADAYFHGNDRGHHEWSYRHGGAR